MTANLALKQTRATTKKLNISPLRVANIHLDFISGRCFPHWKIVAKLVYPLGSIVCFVADQILQINRVNTHSPFLNPSKNKCLYDRLQRFPQFYNVPPPFQIFTTFIQINKQPHFLTTVSRVIRRVTGQANFVSDVLSQKGRYRENLRFVYLIGALHKYKHFKKPS